MGQPIVTRARYRWTQHNAHVSTVLAASHAVLTSGKAVVIMTQQPANPLGTFGAELRAHRANAGWSQAELAPKLFISPSLASALENGTRAPKRDLAELCDRVFETTGTFARLWRLTVQQAWPSWFAEYAQLEEQATRIHKWELRYVPGLLQTADYARAVMKAGRPREASDIIEEDVRARIDRQEILTRTNPPLAWFVIDESVLYRAYGGPNVMHHQIKRLSEFAELPSVVIQILPFSITDHPGADGPLTILEFDGSPSVGYAEGRGSGRLIESPADVAQEMECYDMVRAAALPRSKTIEMIKRVENSE
jgi:transcriptional regulator with XRE-family HTH domain